MNKFNSVQENKISSVLNVFETGDISLDYSGVYVYEDGNNGRKQVTLGIGFTEDSGTLAKVIKTYIEVNGLYSEFLKPYLSKIGTGVLHSNQSFKSLLKQTCDDTRFIETQDFIYRQLYVQPARKLAEDLGLTLPLSFLVIQDSKLHGSFDIVRKLFPEVPPVKGGDEKKFILAYCKARRTWWLNHPKNPSKKIEGKGTYRMDCFIQAINENNWDLSFPLNANGTKI